MNVLKSLYTNHPFANITFIVVLITGFFAYSQMPREQDPEINFNFVSIVTILPGASAKDVELKVTSPLEDSIKQVKDIRFVASSSREGVSNILIRFNEINNKVFTKRVTDLRREVQNKANSELPDGVVDPRVMEVTTSNGFPTALVLVRGFANDELLRRSARDIKRELELIKGVDNIFGTGLFDPEIHIEFLPERLAAAGVTASDLSDTVRVWFKDIIAGQGVVGDDQWLVRINGTNSDPSYLSELALVSANRNVNGNLKIEDLARVSRGRENPASLASLDGQPAVMLSVSKKSYTNTLTLIDEIKEYIENKNEALGDSGIEVLLVDDQTVPMLQAINLMQNNALLGLLMVMIVCWVFLGTRIALIIGFGLPFSLAATFLLLYLCGFTINMPVLLGVVIALGMLVDDAVVVVESIYYRMERGMDALNASVEALREVFKPVTASVLTTMAAFLPLMLLSGIVGKFMFVIPFVVTSALALSLFEAYWMVPAHIVWAEEMFGRNNPGSYQENMGHWRTRFVHKVRLQYTKGLLFAFRWPKSALTLAVFIFMLAVGVIVMGWVKVQFFAFDTKRIFYIAVDMPAGAVIQDTLKHAERAADIANKYLKPGEARALTATAGIKFTQEEPLFGDQYGQVVVSLNPKEKNSRRVEDIIDEMREAVKATPGRGVLSFTELKGGPPTAMPISVKVLGNDYKELRAAADNLIIILEGMKGTEDVIDDDTPGQPQLHLTMNRAAIKQAGISPAYISRLLRLHLDGEVVADMRDNGEKLEIVVRAKRDTINDVTQIFDDSIALPNGRLTTLASFIDYEVIVGKSVIKHRHMKRSITVESDLDKTIMDTVEANLLLQDKWKDVQSQYPGTTLDFSGEWDDIQESLDGMGKLFLLGVGLMYLILATQFRSYLQPVLVLVTVPLAFTGVTFGLLVTQNPLSMFTLYGIVALSGIAVNSAIVLLDATNQRLAAGMSPLHATLYAARRRVVPIVITTTTTIAGLFSLAAGIGGKSLVWGPMASSIVSGIAFATILTLFVVPILIHNLMKSKAKRDNKSRQKEFQRDWGV